MADKGLNGMARWIVGIFITILLVAVSAAGAFYTVKASTKNTEKNVSRVENYDEQGILDVLKRV